MHSWKDDNDEYEALGLRVLLKAAVSPEEYAIATTKHCIALGIKEYERQSKIGDAIWHRTFNAFKKQHGRAPNSLEHRALMDAEREK